MSSAPTQAIQQPNLEPHNLITDGQGNVWYPERVRTGQIVRARVQLLYEVKPTEISEGNPREFHFYVAGEIPRGIYDSPINWQMVKTWIEEDTGKVCFEYPQPPGGDVYLKIAVECRGTMFRITEEVNTVSITDKSHGGALKTITLKVPGFSDGHFSDTPTKVITEAQAAAALDPPPVS